MLKILEKNLAGKVLKGYLKRFVELAIVLRDKWRDPFARSEIIIVTLQIAFGIALLTFAYIFFSYLYEGALRTVIGAVMEGVSSGKFENGGGNIIESLVDVRQKNFILFSAISLALVALFTFLITKMTLEPTKLALDSQKRFISDIAHELRTPLSIIKTNNEVALMDEHLDRKTAGMVRDNIDELNRISEIINNVLSFNTVLRPDRMKFDNINMGDVIDSSVEKLRFLAQKKNLDITIKKVSPHVVWGNAVALEQVVMNLLKNAINYTPRNGHITVRVSPDLRAGPDYHAKVILHIEDTGIGIVKKDLMHIFEPFYRAERSRNRGSGSSGLGLTITRELVKLHSGKITIKSEKNRGTTAVVTLPYGKNTKKDEEYVDLTNLSEVSINYLRQKKER